MTVPCAFIGALAVGSLAADPALLRGTYALLMLTLASYLTFTPSISEKEAIAEEECEIPPEDDAIELTSHPALADGRVLTFRAPPKGSVASASVSGAGGLLTGLLGVGVGETLLPQLLRGCCMPLPLAAGTSVATVVATAAAAAAVQFSELASASGDGIASVVPWSLVCYTIPGVLTIWRCTHLNHHILCLTTSHPPIPPGVLIGGQLAPLIASRRLLSDDVIESIAAALFGVVGVAFAAKTIAG